MLCSCTRRTAAAADVWGGRYGRKADNGLRASGSFLLALPASSDPSHVAMTTESECIPLADQRHLVEASTEAGDQAGFTAVVVLGGPDGSTRIRAGCEQYARLVEKGHAAVLVLSSRGGLAVPDRRAEKRRWVVGTRFGPAVPTSDYLEEPHAGTTVENARFTTPDRLTALARGNGRDFGGRPIKRIVLVTSDFHMPRALALFGAMRARIITADARAYYALTPVAVPNLTDVKRLRQLPHARGLGDVDGAAALAAEVAYEAQQLPRDLETLAKVGL